MIFIFFLFWASSSEDALFHYGKKDRASLLPGESEIRPCVFIADGTHDLTERFHVSGIHAGNTRGGDSSGSSGCR